MFTKVLFDLLTGTTNKVVSIVFIRQQFKENNSEMWFLCCEFHLNTISECNYVVIGL